MAFQFQGDPLALAQFLGVTDPLPVDRQIIHTAIGDLGVGDWVIQDDRGSFVLLGSPDFSKMFTLAP